MKSSFTLFLFFVLIVLAGVLWKVSTWNSGSQGERHLETSFASYITGVRGVQRVQLLEVNSVEVIERSSEFHLFWNLIQLPELVVQARIPVKYLYYIDLADPIRIQREGDKVFVTAPALKAGTPAPDVSGISYEVKRGSFFRNPEVELERLRKTITPLLVENAERNIPLVRDQARQELRAIFEKWWTQEMGDDSQPQIEIIFTNEFGKSSH